MNGNRVCGRDGHDTGWIKSALVAVILTATGRVAPAKALEVYDRGVIVVSVRNILPDRTVQGMTVSVSTAPSWMRVLPASTLGPADIGPEKTTDLRIEYAVASIPVPRREVFRYRVDFASRTWFSTPYACDLISRDNFSSFRTECSYLGTSEKFIETFFPDTTPPKTEIEGIFVDSDGPGPIILSPSSRISLSANDPQGEEEKPGSVTMIYYAVDPASLTYASLKVYKDILADAKNGGPFYGDQFSLDEGTHTLVYSSRDDSGNSEPIRIADLVVDGTSPFVAISASGRLLDASTSSFAISSGDSISVLAGDPPSNGTASGISTLICSVDLEPIKDCAKPFPLPRGHHALSVSVSDKASNHASRWVDFFVDVPIVPQPPFTLGR